MNTDTIIEREQSLSIDIYPKRDLAIVRGEGARVWDAEGREYIDCAAGIGVASVGHAHPKVVAAISEQAAKLITCPGIFHNDVRAELLQRLVDIAPDGLERAFLCNSGTEAVEAAFLRLDGVDRVSAGWRTDRACVVTAPTTPLTLADLNRALRGMGYRVLSLERLR